MPDPIDIGAGWTNETKLADLERNNFGHRYIPVGRVDIGKIHQGEIVTIVFVALNALVIVQKIAAAVEDQPIAVDLDPLGMMRGMAVNDRNISALDKAMGKVPLPFRNVITPIRSLMNRDNNHVTRLSVTRDLVGDADGSCLR